MSCRFPNCSANYRASNFSLGIRRLVEYTFGNGNRLIDASSNSIDTITNYNAWDANQMYYNCFGVYFTLEHYYNNVKNRYIIDNTPYDLIDGVSNQTYYQLYTTDTLSLDAFFNALA